MARGLAFPPSFDRLYLIWHCQYLFFSTAIKSIPTATAFAVWTATTLIFIKVAELVFFHQRISSAEAFFMLLIMIGIMGLKIYAVQGK